MTLHRSQQHALDVIDDVLQSAEPRLATMFGVFTDLTRLEAMPAAETLPPGPWWSRYRLPGHRYRPGRQQYHRGQPRYQRGRRAGQRLVRMVLIPLLLMAAASLLIVSLVSSGAGGRRGCGQAAAMVYRVRSAVSDSAGSGGTNCPGRTQPAAGTR